MIKFFLFIKKIHFLLLFILLESLAIHYYANSTSYTKVKLVTASNYVVGGIYSQIAGLNSYFHLRRENQALARTGRAAQPDGRYPDSAFGGRFGCPCCRRFLRDF